MKTMTWLALPLLLLASTAYADRGDRIETRGDRVDARLDRRGERIDNRLDRRGERIDERLDRRHARRGHRGR